MLLRDATLQDGSRADVRIAGETIDAVSSPGRLGVVPDEEVHELAGYVVLPAMAEPHAHLDKAFTAARVVNTPGNLIEAIETWSVHRATVSVEDVAVRAHAGALLALAAERPRSAATWTSARASGCAPWRRCCRCVRSCALRLTSKLSRSPSR